ncbi:MAG: phosphatase PAP2 family protein [Anaerolineae bacterium]|nr:phosphatase PAP2 family protein [Anaerolineae bacterium]
MEPFYEFGLNATQWLQTNYPGMEPVMQVFVYFGRFEFYLLLLPLIYWCIDKRRGAHLTYLIIFSLALNAFAKQLFHEPRPYWLDTSIGLSDEPSFGFISGHAQLSTVLVYFLAAWIRRKWAWIVATIWVILMALSRVYLGVHFVHDVVAGILLGALTLGGYAILMRYFADRFRNRLMGQRLMVLALAPLLFAILYVVMVLIQGDLNTSVPWADFLELGRQAADRDMVISIALLIAIGIGFTLEPVRVCFMVDGPIWIRVIRYIVGMMAAVIVAYGADALIELVTPENALWLRRSLQAVQFFIAGLLLSYWAPILFTRLRLAHSSNEPETPFTVKGAFVKIRKDRKRK